MFVLFDPAANVYYTGKAGPEGTASGWVSSDKKEAFIYAYDVGAEYTANSMNRMTGLHGKRFETVAIEAE